MGRSDRPNRKMAIFLPINRLDGILVHVMNDVVRGRLGPMAKTRARMGKIIGEKDDSEKVICVYTYDYRGIEML